MSSPTEISANSIARCLIINEKFEDCNRTFIYNSNVKLSEAWNALYLAGTEDVDCAQILMKRTKDCYTNNEIGKNP